MLGSILLSLEKIERERELGDKSLVCVRVCFCFFKIWFALYSFFVVGVKEWRILRLSKERDLKPIFLLFASFVFCILLPLFVHPNNVCTT